MKEEDYLKAKEAMRLSTFIGMVIESADLDETNKERLEDVLWGLTSLFLDTYEEGREEFEPENKHFHTGLRW